MKEWHLWLLAGFLIVVAFGLGMMFTRAVAVHRAEGGNGGALVSNRHVSAALGIFFTVIAVAMAADTMQLHLRVSRFVTRQTECNTQVAATEDLLSQERKKVDRAAADYDVALHDWLVAGVTKGFVPAEDPAYISVQQRLDDLAASRLNMLRAYAEHPFVSCDGK